MAETTTAAPARVSREATQPMRSMFASRSAFEKPSPYERCVRTTSPSSRSTSRPRRSSSGATSSEMVVFPDAREAGEPEREPAHFVWMPHSILSESAQRPARSSWSRLTGRVHGMQPIEG